MKVIIDHKMDYWRRLRWPRGKFPPWQIPTMVGICPWWWWWESVSDKTPPLTMMMMIIAKNACEVALFAYKGLFSKMLPHVYLEITSSVTWIVALITEELLPPWMCWYMSFKVSALFERRFTLVATEWFFIWMYEHLLLEGTCCCAGKVALFAVFYGRTLTQSAGILGFYGNFYGIFAKKSNKKSNPIFPILSVFFRFLDFSRLLDFQIPQL